MKRLITILVILTLISIACEKSKEIVKFYDDYYSESFLKKIVDIKMIDYDSIEFSINGEVILPSTRIKTLYFGPRYDTAQFVPTDTIVPVYLNTGSEFKFTFPKIKKKLFDETLPIVSYKVRFEFEDQSFTDVDFLVSTINFAYNSTSVFLYSSPKLVNMVGKYFEDIEITDTLIYLLGGANYYFGTYDRRTQMFTEFVNAFNTDVMGIIGNSRYSSFYTNFSIDQLDLTNLTWSTFATNLPPIRGMDAANDVLYVLVEQSQQYKLYNYNPSGQLNGIIDIPYDPADLNVEDIEVNDGIAYFIFFGKKIIKRYDLLNHTELSDLIYPIKNLGGLDVRDGFIYSADDSRLIITQTFIGDF